MANLVRKTTGTIHKLKKIGYSKYGTTLFFWCGASDNPWFRKTYMHCKEIFRFRRPKWNEKHKYCKKCLAAINTAKWEEYNRIQLEVFKNSQKQDNC